MCIIQLFVAGNYRCTSGPRPTIYTEFVSGVTPKNIRLKFTSQSNTYVSI